MPVIEEYFGKDAGTAWNALKKNGPSTINGLKRATKLGDRQLYGALGWLGREGKIKITGDKPLFYKFQLC